jgi:hypothetical protein
MSSKGLSQQGIGNVAAAEVVSQSGGGTKILPPKVVHHQLHLWYSIPHPIPLYNTYNAPLYLPIRCQPAPIDA